MTTATSVAFAIFFACCIAQFPLGRRVRQVLAERHPDVLAEISRKSWIRDNAVLSFATSDRVRQLRDPELSRAALHMKWLQAIATGSWLVLLASLFLSAVDGGAPLP